MRTWLCFIAAAVVFGSLTDGMAAPPGDGWRLLYNDEFDGPSLDESKWSFGFGWGTNSGSFGESNRRENLRFENGMAVLKAECADGTYYSAAINTKGKMMQRYGYWEVRAKVSAHVSGVLPAFWQKLAHEDWPPELDIYEFFGTQTKQAATIHWDEGGHRQSGSKVDIGDMTADFHVIGLEYAPDYIRWWTDGEIIREITPSSHGAFFSQWDDDDVYSMINIHVTDKYHWLGSVDKSKLPVYVWVDYFRMYTDAPTPVRQPLVVHQRSASPRAAVFMIRDKRPVVDRSGRFLNPAGRVMSSHARALPGLRNALWQAGH